MPEPLLDEDDFTILNEALDRIEDNKENIVRAKQAGFDVDVVEKRLEDSETKIRRIKTAFFPNR